MTGQESRSEGTAGDYADRYDPDTDFDHWYTDAALRVILPLVRAGDRVLELGCGTGRMTAAVVERGAQVLGVERAAEYLARAASRVPAGAQFVHADLDDWTLPDGVEGFQHVLLTNVLHEVKDPERLLDTARHALAPSGVVHVTLQNPTSVHRLVGQVMGLIDDLQELSALGQALGSHGLWTAEQLTALARRAGLDCIYRRGLLFKPLPNKEMSALDDKVIEGFVRLADQFPECSAMNYLLLTPAPADGVQ